ncbi:unnamed protein product [Lampetra planeri]
MAPGRCEACGERRVRICQKSRAPRRGGGGAGMDRPQAPRGVRVRAPRVACFLLVPDAAAPSAAAADALATELIRARVSAQIGVQHNEGMLLHRLLLTTQHRRSSLQLRAWRSLIQALSVLDSARAAMPSPGR